MTQVRKCFLVILSVVTFNSHVSVRYGVPHPQPAFICSKSAMETPDYVWNLFKLNNRMTPVFPYTIRCFLMFSGDIETDLILVALLLTLSRSHKLIVDFEQVNASWDLLIIFRNYFDFSPYHRWKFSKWTTFLVEDVSVYRINVANHRILFFSEIIRWTQKLKLNVHKTFVWCRGRHMKVHSVLVVCLLIVQTRKNLYF